MLKSSMRRNARVTDRVRVDPSVVPADSFVRQSSRRVSAQKMRGREIEREIEL